MREFSSEFNAHIGSGETSLVNCWRISRVDGLVFGFTDHDEKLVFEGLEFLPSFGLDSGEVASKLGSQVDSSEIVGIISSSAISEADVLLGKYDNATVESFKVNWKDVSVRALLRIDSVGEITRVDGVFRLELRSSQHSMNVNKGRVYQSLCDSYLGSAKCSIDIDLAVYKSDLTVLAIEGRQNIAVSLLSAFADNWFTFGYGVWTSGKRAGKKDDIILQRESNNQSIIGFVEPVDEWVEIGDQITIFAGCDRRLETCSDKFSNVANFRGCPHIPGSDFVLRYPRGNKELDGRVLVS